MQNHMCFNCITDTIKVNKIINKQVHLSHDEIKYKNVLIIHTQAVNSNNFHFRVAKIIPIIIEIIN